MMDYRGTWFSPKWFLVLSLALVAGGLLQAQEKQAKEKQPQEKPPTYFNPVEMKGQWLQGSERVAQHENDGTIGVFSKDTEAGHKIQTVIPGGPAATAGILAGDVVVALDGASVKGLDTSEWRKAIAQKKAGEKIELTINRNRETKNLTVVVDTRKHVYENDPAYQNERKLAPAVGQYILGGSVSVSAFLFQKESDAPGYAHLELLIASKDAPPFEVDDRKFFVLDGTRQQLRHISLDELKYDIQRDVARYWRGGDYPPPPPPPAQQQYTLSGVERGNYTITNFGGGMVSITGRSTYTAAPQQDYSEVGNQLGYAIGLGMQRHFDAKSNQKLEEQANKLIAAWEASYFHGQAPILAGERRSGEIVYWTGSDDRKPQPPFRVVLFFTDPRTQKQESVTFAFGTGAENGTAQPSEEEWGSCEGSEPEPAAG